MTESHTLTYDSTTHTYRMDDVVLPHVTEILERTGIIDYSFLTTDRQFYLDRGTAIHSACHLLDYGELDWDTVDERIVPFVQAWDHFKEETGVQIVESEEVVHSVPYRYAGALDKLVTWGDRLALLDIKTNQVPWWTALQTMAYAIAKGISVYRCGIALKENGHYSVTSFKDNKKDREDFFATLRVFNLKREHGK